MSNLNPPTIIAFASPKGGVGKSTNCLSIAGALAAKGYPVHIYDFDQTETLWRWYSTNPAAREITNLKVEKGPTDKIDVFINDVWKTKTGFVLIDLAGSLTGSMISLAAFALLTITPSKLSEPDILEATKLSQKLQDLGQRIGKPIMHRILLNELPQSSFFPAFQKHMMDQILASQLQRFETIIHSRSAYPEAFFTGQPPHFGDQSRPAIAKAVAELDFLLEEIFGCITEEVEVKDAA